MQLKHVGLACSSEENSDKFYRDLLGLNKSEPKTLPSEIAKAIFNLDADLQMINYMDSKLHFEVFITSLIDNNSKLIAHSCIEVDALSDFIEKCRTLNVEIRQIPKGDRTLTFIRDFDGNLFEIKHSAL